MAAMSTVARSPSDPLTEDDLTGFPWGIGTVEVVDGVLYVRAAHGDGFTPDDVDALPDDGRRHDLLDGVIVVSPAPSQPHQGALAQLIVTLIVHKPDDLRVLPAPVDITMSPHDQCQPDVIVLRAEEFGSKHALLVLAVEVLSPSTRRDDLGWRRRVYERRGIPSYWIVDPIAPSLTVLELGTDGRYAEVAVVTGDQSYHAERPFPVRLVPTELMVDSRR